MHNCLMIKTKDQRQFFTYLKNYKQLVEFSRVFNAEISVVKTRDAEILELPDLAPALCDKNYKSKADYEIVNIKVAQKKRRRKQMLLNAQKIKKYISNQFKTGKIVTLQSLRAKFKKHNLTAACLCNHLRNVKAELEEEGFNVKKVGHGKYKLD